VDGNAGRDRRAQIEARLALGHTAGEAIADIRRDALRSGLIPIVNAMTTAGVVSLPGMMTGQILAGSPPMEAAKYQLMILFLIAAGTGLGAATAVILGANRLFDEVGLNKREAKEFVDAYFETIKSALEDGENVKLSGFGNFQLRDKKERPGRNPKTGEEIPISARRVVTFRPGQKLRARVEAYVGSGE